jgi:hypothetical protein
MAAANRLLIGQIALERGWLTQEQLRQCLDLQAGQPNPKSVGALLVELRFLTEAQITQLCDEQKRRLAEEMATAPASKDELAFGRLLVKGGHATEAQVNEALRAQQDLAERNVRKRLGELLVETGRVTPDVVRGVLKQQGKALMSCTFCGRHMNVVLAIADRAACTKCGMPLEEKIAGVAAGETAYLLPAVDVTTLRAVAPPAPVPPPAPAVPPPPPPPAERKARWDLLVVIIALAILILFLLSRSSAR